MIRSLLQNPEIVRSFRTQVRRKRDVVWMGLLYFFVLSVIYAKMAIGHQENWLNFYNTVIFIQFYVFLLVGTLQTAAVFAGEQEQERLDFLLMAPIDRSKIIVGRLLGAPILAYLLMAVSLPFSIAGYLHGGVSSGLFVVNIVQTLVCGLLFHSWGLRCSLAFKKQYQAYTMALIAPPALFASMCGIFGVTYESLLLMPIYPLMAGLDWGYDWRFLRLSLYPFELSWLISGALMFWSLRMATNRLKTGDAFLTGSREIIAFFATAESILLCMNGTFLGTSGKYSEEQYYVFALRSLLFNLVFVSLLVRSPAVAFESLVKQRLAGVKPRVPRQLLNPDLQLAAKCCLGLALGLMLIPLGDWLMIKYMTGGVLFYNSMIDIIKGKVVYGNKEAALTAFFLPVFYAELGLLLATVADYVSILRLDRPRLAAMGIGAATIVLTYALLILVLVTFEREFQQHMWRFGVVAFASGPILVYAAVELLRRNKVERLLASVEQVAAAVQREREPAATLRDKLNAIPVSEVYDHGDAELVAAQVQ